MRHPMLKLSVIVLMLAGVVLSAGGLVHAQSIPKDVERELRCTCGCLIPFEDCVCGTATAIKESAAGMLATGRTKLEVLDGLVAQYGEKVLLTFDGDSARSSTDENSDTSAPGVDPIVVPPGPRIGDSILDTPAALSDPGGSSNVMTWLVLVLGGVGGVSVVLAFYLIRRRKA